MTTDSSQNSNGNDDTGTEANVHAIVDGAIGWIVFDHQARRNAMTIDMWRAVPELCASLDADDDVRVVVLRGAGETAFVAGADISQFDSERTGSTGGGYEAAVSGATDAIAAVSKPVIAMVHGFCIGGGLAIALAADIRYAADDARFGLPPARLGIGYKADGIGGLVDLIGPSMTKEFVYTADLFDAESALRIGLANRVLPKDELEAFLRAQAATMAARAPLSQRAAKLAVADHLRAESDRRPDEVAAAIRACASSDDYAEGVAAFMEKRPARFTGR